MGRLECGAAFLLMLTACAPTVTPPPAPPPIQRPAEPLPITVAVRSGGFDRSHLHGPGVVDRFAAELSDAGLFDRVVWGPGSGDPEWELELAASDEGIEGGYRLELQVLLLRRRELVATYFSEQKRMQREGARKELVVGQADLLVMADRAVHGVLVELANDLERLRAQPGLELR